MTASIRSAIAATKKEIGLKARAKKHQDAKWVLDSIYRLRNELSEIAYGIAYADQTARIDGQMSFGLRDMPASTMVVLIHSIYASGIRVSGDVSQWLWKNRDLIVG